MSKAKKRIYKILRILGKIFLGILIFLLLVILFVRSPWGQGIIKDKVISSIEEKTGANIDLERLYVKFNGDIQVDELLIEDPAGDTVAYAGSLSANIPFMPLIKGNSFDLNDLEASQVKAKIIRKDSLKGFNFDFLMKAYASDTTQTAAAVDTSAAPMQINIGDIDLQDFDIIYKDDVTGIDSEVKFENLQLEFSETDLQNMIFRVNDAMLGNAVINYKQTKPFPESDSEEAPLPVIDIRNLKFTEVKGVYDSQPDSLYSSFDIANFELDNTEFDLKEQFIKSDGIDLSKSRITLKMQQIKSKESKQEDSPSDFEWPDWKIDITGINLENNSFNYFVNNATVEKGVFNPDAVKLDSLTFSAGNLTYAEERLNLAIDEFRFKEASGLDLNEFNINAVITDQKIELSGIDLDINQNSLSGKIAIDYKSLNSFIKEPGDAGLNIDLGDIFLDLQDIYRFQPDLRKNEYFKALASSPIRGSLTTSGKLANLDLQSLRLKWSSTSISGYGTVINLQDPDNIAFNLPDLKVSSNRKDLQKFVKEKELGIQLPKQVSLNGSFAGSATEIKTNSVLKTDLGSIQVDGKFDVQDNIVFNAEIQGDSIALGTLLQNDALGDLQINLKASGSGSNINDLNADLDSKISSFTYNNYEFRDINITGDIKDGQGPLNLDYQDTNLNMNSKVIVDLDSISPRFGFDLNIIGADLEALGITRKEIKTGFELSGWFKGNSTAYELEAKIKDGVAVYNNETYLLGSFDAAAFVGEDTTSVKINNRILDLDLQSNASPVAFSNAIDRHFKRYISEDYQEDSLVNPVNLKLDATISEAPILNEVFLVNLEELDTVDINIDFREKDRVMDAFVSIPYLNYYSSKIDSLKLSMKSDPEDLNFEFAFNSLDVGPLAIKETILKGKVVQQKLNLDFASFYDETQLVHVNSELNFQGDTLRYHINPQDLILNTKEWNIDESNQLSFDTDYLDFQNFRIFRNNQEMQLSNDKPGIEKEHLSLDFRNFKLEALLNYFNPEEQLATGQLNGNIIYEEPFGETGLLADMEINDFKILGVDLNTLSLEGNSAGFSTYDFALALKGGEVDLDLTGTYTAAEPSAEIDMNLDLNSVKMTALEGFSQGEIKNASGSFSGNFTLNGTVLEPEYKGSLNFDQARFNVAYLNAAFILPDENLTMDNDGVYFQNFNINDTNNNSIVVNGEVLTENLLNPTFDLDIQASDFRLLNSTVDDNDLFYGTASVDVDAQITGDLNLPEVDMNVEINESTDFTYVVPETELQIKEREGVVIFLNKENPDAILSQTEEESYVVSGYKIFARISVVEGAKFNVIINPETGDKFQVQGEGDLLFNMYPNGRTSLTGIYEINDGFYEMSLYNLVKRRFEIADGSRVSWAGDPFDAQLDVRAIYRVETSASALMATQISASDAGSTDRFRQKLPFLVYLNIDGDLMEPKISFGLDMPEEQQGIAGGEIFGRVQQLNNQEQELNKQVFSLLVLNRFFPASGADGSSGGTLAVARDNLNSALSDQLNMLSSKILGESGVKLNFDVDSFTDYQGDSPQERTQLGISAQKAFLDDRLIVEVGSEVDVQGGNQSGQASTPLIGNVSISYLLDENGVWRLKGFSRSQFENVIDGQVVVSGIALIFTKEFNKFKNMFEKAVMEKVQNEDTDENDKKENSEDKN
ncbi:translocation/assembly module TamB domain-containing protein [Christiangramia sabulilitoris]|uniref:Translocation/assembly module TamB n=1 Tax=Christiangramia sabulilitoris TaxID=2583991 RepID=A0A550I6B0_9FLAO|nr:translocation/assembly module TamB domain-containing protein [Christiangramia sabulilitoris]TRO66506.1 translocation/assembly module TamB [Christiangramia sabulilitoris]